MVALLTARAADGAGDVHWLRDPAISPDGKSVAFRYDGDLYLASVQGGSAHPFRGSVAYEAAPVWLPDGKSIAYAAKVDGNFDIYVAHSNGTGEARRITWHSRDELPVAAAREGNRLLMRSGRIEWSASRAAYPMTFAHGEESLRPRNWMGLFSLPFDAGAPQPLIEPVSLEGTWTPDGSLVFSARAGSEFGFRRHERSPATSDIWIMEKEGRRFRQLTHFDGHDTTPVVSREDGLIYFLSERNGTRNIWRMPLEGDSRAAQVTFHERLPVAGLSISDTGTLVYSYRGELYAGSPAQGFQLVRIVLPTRESPVRDGNSRDLSAGISSALLSPTGRIAVVRARGEVYAIERGSQRSRKLFDRFRGVKTSPSFSADGRLLLVVRELGGSTDLLLARSPEGTDWLDRKNEPRTSVLAATKTDTILAAALSPAGNQILYSTGGELRRLLLRQGTVDVVLTRQQGLTEEAQPFLWHPHANVVAMPWRNLRRDALEVALLDLATGKVRNVSQSGFMDRAPSWSADGRMLLWLSDRYGSRSFGGSDGSSDVQALRFDADRLHDLPDGPVVRSRLTAESAHLSAVAAAPGGNILLRLQRGVRAQREVWRQELPDGVPVRLASLPAGEKRSEYFRCDDSIQVGADGSFALVVADGSAHWLDLNSGKPTQVVLSDIPAGDAAAEQRWIFEHIVREVGRAFYRPERLSQIAWAQYVSEYRRLLPAVRDPDEFTELMQELLGELNASHTFFERAPAAIVERTGSLGAIFDPAHQGPGLRLLEILRGSPLDENDRAIRAGDLVTEIEGVPIPENADPARYLANTVDRPTRITIRSSDGAERLVELRPVDTRREADLFYRRWVECRRAQAAALSNGKLGYVHMPFMGEEPMRLVIDDTLGRYVDAQGIVLDLRYNQGGWMHEPLLIFFSQNPFAFALSAYGQVHATEPAVTAGRPLITLVNAATYSNGFETARLLQEQGISRLVGSPVAGTGLGWNIDPLPYWEYGYGIAHDASRTRAGEYWEGQALSPDVDTPADRLALREGRDVQLQAAVETLLKRGLPEKP